MYSSANPDTSCQDLHIQDRLDPAAFLRPFAGLAQELIAVPVTGEQAGRPPEQVTAAAEAVGIAAATCTGVEPALRFLAARDWTVPPRILIAGSLYLAGEVLRLNGTPPR